MKIQYCSDLHLEFPENKKFILENPIIPVGDILILAGDIVPFALMDLHEDFFDYVSKNFKFTFWIPGNHEYYYYERTDKFGTIDIKIRDNVFLVNNTVKEIENVKSTNSLLPAVSSENVIHFSAIPWLDFTSISHARSFSHPDSCPKISFGKMTENNAVKEIPVSIHGHHALMDGYHAGLFIDKFQDLLKNAWYAKMNSKT